MGPLASDQQRKNVDFALQFLARDTTELEATSGQNLEELAQVVDNMLACLSNIISNSLPCHPLIPISPIQILIPEPRFDVTTS